MPLPGGFTSSGFTFAPPASGGAVVPAGPGAPGQIGNGVPPDALRVLAQAFGGAARLVSDAAGVPLAERAIGVPANWRDAVFIMSTQAAILLRLAQQPNADGLVPSGVVRTALTATPDAELRQYIYAAVHVAMPTVDVQAVVDRIDAGYYLGMRARDAQAAADQAAAQAAQAAQIADQARADAARAAAHEQELADAQAAQAAAQAEAFRQQALAAQHEADQLHADQAAHSKLVIGLSAAAVLAALGLGAWAWHSR